jgi:hypothetical protein
MGLFGGLTLAEVPRQLAPERFARLLTDNHVRRFTARAR